MKKRIVSFSIVLVMILTILPLSMRIATADMGKAGYFNTISLGEFHSAAITKDGALYTWGENNSGKLGHGDSSYYETEPYREINNNRSTPTLVSSLSNVVAVSFGRNSSAAITASGDLYTWGANDYGVLGHGDSSYNVNDSHREPSNDRSIPTRVSALSGVIAVSLGPNHCAAITIDGDLYTWGLNRFGELGHGDYSYWETDTYRHYIDNDRSTPTRVASLSNVVAVSLGFSHSAAITADGDLYTWGKNSDGQLGLGDTTDRATPTKVQSVSNVTAVSLGGEQSAAITADGDLFTWGQNFCGELGYSSDDYHVWSLDDGPGGTEIRYTASPTKVPGLTKTTAVSWGIGETPAKPWGLFYCAAVTEGGDLYTWGCNGNGQLGLGDANSRTEPTKVQGITGIVSISSGYGHSAALTANGCLWVWGNNYHGQVGDGTAIYRRTPLRIMDNVAFISAGYYHSMAIKADGGLWAWGDNVFGQLGDSTTTARSTPVKIMDGVVYVSTGLYHSLAIKADGSLWAWGRNAEGQLGDSTTTARSTPVKIMDNVASVAAGGYHSMAIKSDGSLWVWGSNYNGQLGDGTATDRNTPIKIMDAVTIVSAGRSHSMALKADGSLWVWGDNYNRQLGDGTTANRRAPLRIMNDVATISAGEIHSMAIKTDGSLWAWGWNAGGQIGDGTTINRSTPVKIMDEAAHVSAGGDHSMVLKTDGSLWAWGDNEHGQLGEGIDTYRNAPVRIMESVDSISAGRSYNMVIKADGSLWVKGSNYDNVLGEGVTIFRLTPVKIMDDVMIHAGDTSGAIPGDYDYDSQAPGGGFTPSRDVLRRIDDSASATYAINEVIASMTPEQRRSGDALDTVALFIEAAVRAGANKSTSGEVIMNAALLSDLTSAANGILANAGDTLALEDVNLLRGLRTDISIRTGGADHLVVTFPDNVSGIGFDRVTVEAELVSVTLGREYIVQGGGVEVNVATAENDRGSGTGSQGSGDGGDAGNGGRFERLDVWDFWSVAAVALILMTWGVLAAFKHRFRAWVVPAFCTAAILANVLTFFIMEDGANQDRAGSSDTAAQGPGGISIDSSSYDGAGSVIEVIMSEGLRATISLPAEGGEKDCLVLLNSEGTPQYSKYNPVTGTIDTRVRESGVYTLREYTVSFIDVEQKNELMREAIEQLASRNIMTGTTDGFFYPDKSITRAELTSAIVRAFDLLDLEAVSGFADLSRDDWYYAAVATAERERLISGFDDNTFRGDVDIPKDQLVVLSANTLIERMGYIVPGDVEAELARYLDRAELAEWSEERIALATQSNILIYRVDNMFAPASIMTRGDAAILLYRVFNKVW